jgi:Domain of unknown function (DUF4388)
MFTPFPLTRFPGAARRANPAPFGPPFKPGSLESETWAAPVFARERSGGAKKSQSPSPKGARLRAVNAPTSPMPVLNGRLRQHQLPPLLEFLMSTSHTGTLELEGPSELTAEVVVESGSVLFASCETDDGFLRGIDALRAILRWRFAYVSVHDQIPPSFPTNITGSIFQVLLEAARLEDESSRERTLPEGAAVHVRSNVGAYQGLSQLERNVIQRAKRGTSTVTSLRTDFPGVPLDGAILELVANGLLEVEGFKLPETQSISAESKAFLGGLTPVRVNRNAPFLRGAIGKALNPLHETVFALVDGLRSAEQIRVELRLSPGALREALQSLRASGRVDYG